MSENMGFGKSAMASVIKEDLVLFIENLKRQACYQFIERDDLYTVLAGIYLINKTIQDDKTLARKVAKIIVSDGYKLSISSNGLLEPLIYMIFQPTLKFSLVQLRSYVHALNELYKTQTPAEDVLVIFRKSGGLSSAARVARNVLPFPHRP